MTPHVERPRALLIGSGAGIPAMLALALELGERSGEGFKPLVLLESDLPFAFRARPSSILIAGMPDGVIASVPVLEERGIASRLATTAGSPGCHDGPVADLARCWLGTLARPQLDEVEIFSAGPAAMQHSVASLAREFGTAVQS